MCLLFKSFILRKNYLGLTESSIQSREEKKPRIKAFIKIWLTFENIRKISFYIKILKN